MAGYLTSTLTPGIKKIDAGADGFGTDYYDVFLSAKVNGSADQIGDVTARMPVRVKEGEPFDGPTLDISIDGGYLTVTYKNREAADTGSASVQLRVTKPQADPDAPPEVITDTTLSFNAPGHGSADL